MSSIINILTGAKITLAVTIIALPFLYKLAVLIYKKF